MRREVLKKVLNIALVALFVMVCSWLPAWAEKAPKDANSKANDKNVQKQPAAAKQPRMVIDIPNYDAGEVWEGEDVVHTFIIKNKGDAQLNVTKVKPG